MRFENFVLIYAWIGLKQSRPRSVNGSFCGFFSDMTKILHGPNNISGMAFLMAAAQRSAGFDAESVTRWQPVFQYESDRWLDPTGASARPVNPRAFNKNELFEYDVYHFYFGQGYYGEYLKELPKLKKTGKKIFMTFCGCDIRDSKATMQSYNFSVCKECWPTACSKNRIHALEFCKKYASGVFVSTVDLMDFYPDATWLPQPVSDEVILNADRNESQNTSKLEREFSHEQPLRIVHAPSDPGKKGTRYITKAVSKLRQIGYPVELDLVTNASNEEVMIRAAKADIAIDQLMAGAYGSFSVEMMAMGIPTICFLRESWNSRYPEPPPILSAEPDKIEGLVADLVAQKFDLPKLSKAGLSYVKKYHTAEKVAQIAIETYQI